MSASVRLSPFVLAERIGVGGMGAVYRAKHAETGQQVAIKVLLAEVARRADNRRDFRREVQALAKLHHPAIASVLDYGAIDAQTAERGPEPFVEGAPWFAMEYVDSRPMPKGSKSWRWEDLETVLLSTLDGLAHAHARSIVHRDLKPDNILLESDQGDGAPGTKLVDFGVARIFDPDFGNPTERSQRITGTPKYMAPEQIRGAWRDQGPWTDLYALGCVVWRIVCDSPPFDGETTEDVLEGHLQNPPPEFNPQMPVPEGLEAWLRGLLQRDIARRTGRSADAARQLVRLDAPQTAPVERKTPTRKNTTAPTVDEPTLQSIMTMGNSTLDSDGKTTSTELSTSGAPGARPSDGSPSEVAGGSASPKRDDSDRPPISPDWRRGGPDRKAAVVPKAGLELFALREVPVVDRDQERDRLWEALRRVDRYGEPEFVTLEAAAGTGKSRLAEWLCRRAREIGAANVLRATHSVSSAPDAGLRNMIRSKFRTGGLSRSDVYQRLLRRLPTLEGKHEMRAVDARALTELLRPTDDDAASIDGPPYRFSSPDHKYGLVRRLFERLSAERPLVLWLDDLQWGRQAVGVLEELFGTSGDAPPVLAVATVRSDLLAENADLEERLENLQEQASGERIELAPLGPDDHRELIDSLLHLDDELADTLAERTEGNPLFATQLLRELVDGGRLEAEPDGFAVPTGASLEPPEDVHELWIRRLRRLVVDLDGDAEPNWRAVEWAATLGREVDGQEWREVCRRLDLGQPDVLQDELIQRGLAERTAQGWTFAHGMLVDSLQRRAREEGRLRTHHRRSAELLEELYPKRPNQTAARRADHWIGTHEHERALEPLLHEAKRLEEREDFEERKQVLERRHELIDTLDLPDDDPRHLENGIELAWYDVFLGSEPDAVLARLDGLRRRADQAECERLVAKAWVCIARCRGQTGESAPVVEAARKATRWAEKADEESVLFEATSEWGWAEYVLGNLDEAEERFVKARTYAENAGDHYHAVDSKYGLAWVSVSRGDDERASTLFEEVLQESRTAGYRGIEANSLNGLGEVARFEGDVEEARRRYRQYEERQRELNRPGDVAISHLNRAQVEVLAGEFASALMFLEGAERQLDALSRKEQWIHLIRLSRLAYAAGENHWSEFDELLSHYTDGWPEDARLVKDHPWILEIAGNYAREADEDERARRVWQLARDLWDRLGDDEARERVADKLEE